MSSNVDARVQFTAVVIAHDIDRQPSKEEVVQGITDFLKMEFDVVFVDRTSFTVEYLDNAKCQQ